MKKFNSIDNTYIARESFRMGGSSGGGGGGGDPPPLENHKWLNVFRKSSTDTLQGANEPGGSNCFSRDVNIVLCDTVNSDIFESILYSRIALKHIFPT